MKATIRGQKFSGYYGPKVINSKWLFAKKGNKGRSYSVALAWNGEIVEIDDEPAFNGFANKEIAEALIAAS